MAEIRFDNQEKTGGANAVNLDAIAAIEKGTDAQQNPVIRFIPMDAYKRNRVWTYTGASATTNRDEAYDALKTSDMVQRT